MRELLPVLFVGLVPIAVLTLIVTGTAFSLVVWQPPVLRAVQFGTPNSENGITALASDPTGVYAAGFVGYQNATPTYLFVEKYDLNGRLVWTNRFDNPYASQIWGIAKGLEGLYVAGFGNQTSVVRGFDLNGNQIWLRQFGNFTTTASGITASSATLYVGGFNGTTYFLRDYDFNGTLLWSNLFGTYNSRLYVWSDSSGVFVLEEEIPPTPTQTGNSLIRKFDSNGTLLWKQTCICNARGLTGDSAGIYVAGTVQTGGGASNGFLAKYDFNGKQLWTTSFNPPGYNSFGEIEASADPSGIYLATTTSDGRGIVMEYDGNGHRVWSIQLPWTIGTGSLTPGDHVTVQGSGVYVGGDSSLSVGSEDLAFLIQLSKSSSLVFFGTNPPLSFGLLGLSVVAASISILFLSKKLKKTSRSPGEIRLKHQQMSLHLTP